MLILKLKIVNSLDHDALDFLARGGRVVMLGHKPFCLFELAISNAVRGREK